jgi:hypothetical protein
MEDIIIFISASSFSICTVIFVVYFVIKFNNNPITYLHN